jgi:hypothetical protein
MKPGLGCVLIAYNGLTDDFIPSLITGMLAISPLGTFAGGSYSCRFRNPTDLVPIPVGARGAFAAQNVSFPGSFAAIRSRLMCQFSTYTRADPNYPVQQGNPQAGFYGSLTV